MWGLGFSNYALGMIAHASDTTALILAFVMILIDMFFMLALKPSSCVHQKIAIGLQVLSHLSTFSCYSCCIRIASVQASLQDVFVQTGPDARIKRLQ